MWEAVTDSFHVRRPCQDLSLLSRFRCVCTAFRDLADGKIREDFNDTLLPIEIWVTLYQNMMAGVTWIVCLATLATPLSVGLLRLHLVV